MFEMGKEFLELKTDKTQIFYDWGHAYEFDGDQNWEVIEKLVAFLAEHKDKIWFATNGEIIEYVTAYRRLEYSVDGTWIYNPSAIDVTIRTSMHTTQLLKAGQVTGIDPTPL